MYCLKCGAQIVEGAAFCSACGSPVGTSPTNNQDTPTSTVPPTPPTPPAQPYGMPTYMTPPPQQQKNKNASKKKLLAAVIGGIAGVLVLVIIIVACSWKSIAHAAMGEVDFYLWREASTLSDILSTDVLDDIFEDQSFSAQTNATIDVPRECFKLSTNVDISHKKNKNQTVLKTEPEMSIDSEKMSFGEMKLDCNGELLSFSAKDITDAKLVTELLPLLTNSSAASQLPDFDDAVEIIAKIIKDAEKQTLSSSITKGKEYLDGKKYSTVTIAFDSKNSSKFLITVINEIMNDPEAKKLFKAYVDKAIEVCEMLGVTDEGVTFDKLVTAALEELSEYENNEETLDLFTYTIFYDSKSNVVNRRVYDPREDFGFDIRTTKDEDNGTIIITANDVQVIEFEKTQADGSASYSLVCHDGNNVFINAQMENLCVLKCNGVNVVRFDSSIKIKELFDDDIDFAASAFIYNNEYTIKGRFFLLNNNVSQKIFRLDSTTKLSNKPDMTDYEEPDSANGLDFQDFAYKFENDLENYVVY